MSRYIPRKKSDITVSQEFTIIEATISAVIMLGIWKILVGSIKGVKKLTSLASSKIKTIKDERTAKKMQKALDRTETLATALVRVGNRLNQSKEMTNTVNVNVARLGGSNLKAIQHHLGKDVLMPLEMLLSRTEKQILKVYDKNVYLENEGSDLDIHDEIEPLVSELKAILINFFKNKPFNENGLSFEVVTERSDDGDYVKYNLEKVNEDGNVTLADQNEAANLLILASKLLELHTKYVAIPMSNYAQHETYWIWDVQEMLGATVRDCINVVARTLNETETKADE